MFNNAASRGAAQQVRVFNNGRGSGGGNNAPTGNSGAQGNGFVAKSKEMINGAFKGVQKATDFVSSSMYILIFVSLIVLVAVIIYIVIRVRRFAMKSVPLTLEPVINANPMGGEAVRTPAGALPERVSGNDSSVALWLYVDNISDKVNGDHKVILYQGNPESYENGSFFVYMDGNTNKLYVSMRTSGVDESKLSKTDNKVTLADVHTNKSFLTTGIDYVPIQRWVHILITVKDATLTVFLDGELYSLATIYDLPLRIGDVRPVIVKGTGDIMVGGKSGAIGITGFIARAEFFNYALTLKQAKTKYEEGPYKSTILGYLGMPSVGVRSPLYWTDRANATPGSSARMGTTSA